MHIRKWSRCQLPVPFKSSLKKNNYVTGSSDAMKLLLRRTLILKNLNEQRTGNNEQ